jgi:hypothetical protein
MFLVILRTGPLRDGPVDQGLHGFVLVASHAWFRVDIKKSVLRETDASGGDWIERLSFRLVQNLPFIRLSDAFYFRLI